VALFIAAAKIKLANVAAAKHLFNQFEEICGLAYAL